MIFFHDFPQSSFGEEKHEESSFKKCLNCNGNHTANSKQCPVIKKQKIKQIMAHRNVRFLEAQKTVEKWSQPCILCKC
jgi:hypothetical protein